MSKKQVKKNHGDEKKNKKDDDIMEKCLKERKEYLSGWKREKADFLNYKKEEAERMKALLDYKEETLIEEIIPILDGFDEAERIIPENEKEENGYIKGLLMIKKSLLGFMKKRGVEEIECDGNAFDPHFHEAVEMIEEEGKESGLIAEEAAKGYMLNGKVIKPVKVKVVK